MTRALPILALACGLACTKEKQPEEPVCGLHSAGAPVTLLGARARTLSVGARLLPSDRIKAEGPALLECFGAALKVLDGDQVTVGELRESRIEAITLPKYVLKDRTPVKVENPMRPTVMARYSDNRFTPDSALGGGEPTTADYFKAFFTPNGIENMGAEPLPDGPRKLPPPHARPRLSRVHAGELGLAGPMLTVTDDVVFAETDDLATAVLVEGTLYDLGQTVRLILPDGAEARLGLDGTKVELEGPMDLRLR